MEVEYPSNVVNGSQMTFLGAKDVDESEKNSIDYRLECPSNCSSLFQLRVLSRSSSPNEYDQLALTYFPPPSTSSSSVKSEVRSEYELNIYAKAKTTKSMKLKVKVKGESMRFSQSNYQFVVLFNDTLDDHGEERVVGQINAMSMKFNHRIFYEIVSTKIKQIQSEQWKIDEEKTKNEWLKVNSLTGELSMLVAKKKVQSVDQIRCEVVASTLGDGRTRQRMSSKVSVEIFVRSLDSVKKISMSFRPLSSSFVKRSDRNTSTSFIFLDRLNREENLLDISFTSSFYPHDHYLLSSETSSAAFSITPSPKASALNEYRLHLHPDRLVDEEKRFNLNIQIKHQLTQQFLPRVKLEVIFIAALSLSTTTALSTITPNSFHTTPTTILVNEDETSSEFSSWRWCDEEDEYLLKNDSEETFVQLKVMQNNVSSLHSALINAKQINGKEFLFDRCRMISINEEEDPWIFNQSSKRFDHLCSSSICFNLTWINDDNSSSSLSLEKSDEVLTFSQVEILFLLLLLSILFVIISLILLLLICRLRETNVCLTTKTCFTFLRHRFLANPRPQPSSQVCCSFSLFFR